MPVNLVNRGLVSTQTHRVPMIGVIKPLFKRWPLIEGVNDDRRREKRCLTLEILFPGMEIIAKPFAMEAVAAKICETLSSAVLSRTAPPP